MDTLESEGMLMPMARLDVVNIPGAEGSARLPCDDAVLLGWDCGVGRLKGPVSYRAKGFDMDVELVEVSVFFAPIFAYAANPDIDEDVDAGVEAGPGAEGSLDLDIDEPRE